MVTSIRRVDRYDVDVAEIDAPIYGVSRHCLGYGFSFFAYARWECFYDSLSEFDLRYFDAGFSNGAKYVDYFDHCEVGLIAGVAMESSHNSLLAPSFTWDAAVNQHPTREASIVGFKPTFFLMTVQGTGE